MSNKKQAVLSLSGGLDSSTLLLNLLLADYEVTALSFNYGQKHNVELERAQSLVIYINDKRSKKGLSLINHQIIELKGLGPLLNSTLVEGGKEVPEGHYESSNMSQTVVPNRNKIFSSIIQAVALSLAEKNNSKCDIALGIHSGDHAIYFDCRQEFRDADYKAFLLGNENGNLVEYYTPYINMSKTGILLDGVECCKFLGLDFDEVYSRTNTSYKPVLINGEWYSDYLSASSVERVESFIRLKLKDPVKYADSTGPVVWEKVVEEVKKMLTETP